MIGNIEATLQARGLAENTYIVFSSDNGYHMGEHRLLPGKMTAFDTDIRVPLIVVGPGVPAGQTTTRIAENVDLRPTFDGSRARRSRARSTGTAWCRCCDGTAAARLAASGALIEHHGPDHATGDPDLPRPRQRQPARPTRPCARSDAVYVEYRNGEREYYDAAHRPRRAPQPVQPPEPARAQQAARPARAAAPLPRPQLLILARSIRPTSGGSERLRAGHSCPSPCPSGRMGSWPIPTSCPPSGTSS